MATIVRPAIALGLAFLLSVQTRPASAAETAPGVMVSGVDAGYEAARAGLRSGDVLSGWRQGNEHGTLDSPFDVAFVELERAPRGPVQLRGERDGEPLEVTLTWDEWALASRPRFSVVEKAIFVRAALLVRGARDPERDAAAFRELVEQTRTLPVGDRRTWLLKEIAGAQKSTGAQDDMASTFAEAHRVAGEAGRWQVESELFSIESSVWSEVGRPDRATVAAHEAVALHRRHGPLGLAGAQRLLALAELVRSGTVDAAEGRAAAQEALAVAESIAPGSAALSRTLEGLGLLLPTPAQQLAHLERALAIRDKGLETPATANLLYQIAHRVSFDQPQRRLAYARRMADIEERFEPETVNHGISLAALASALLYLGALEEAEPIERHALDIRERLMPESFQVADSLDRLGSIAMMRGDYIQAEAHYRRAVDIDERVAPDTVMLARKLQSLAQITRLTYEPAQAEVHARRALALFEKAGATSDIATCLTVLAGAAEDLGDDGRAEPLYRRALEITRAAGPESPLVSGIHQNLGELLSRAGRLDEAEALYRDALARAERGGDRGQGLAERKNALAIFLLGRRHYAGAEGYLRAALAYFERAAPGSGDEAEICQNLAVSLYHRGRKEEALALLQRATLAYDAQSRRIVRSPEARARFRASNARAYLDLERSLIELGRTEEAFQVSERARAWTLLTQMSERTLGPGTQTPAGLEKEKREADAEYDLWLARRASDDASTEAETQRGLETARRRRDDVRARIRAAAPRAAAFKDPVPLDVAGVRGVLDPGTLLLSYRLDDDTSHIYAVGPGPDDFAVKTVDGGTAAIREAVRAFRERIEARRTPMLQAALLEQSRELSRRLLAPVAALVGRAERLLIVPDGVLHLLPFAALADPNHEAGHRYLVEAKPIHVVSSATVYAALARPRDVPLTAAEIVGVGDPVYPGAKATLPPATNTSVKRGLRLSPLPWARRELEALRELSPRGATLWMAGDATETRAKSLGTGPRLIHFACHGFVDERFPLESGLALSMPSDPQRGDDNGLLQAWEVFENMRIDSDLVTLSACQTGLGKEMAGEGLLGLTWAFQYAGARSVLASLWEVNDASTAELMRAFYRALGTGAAKAEALRRAQLELLHRPATAPPYFWAAFALVGDGH
jgi:CHAT domain-containing protein